MSNELQHALGVLALALSGWLDSWRLRRRLHELEARTVAPAPPEQQRR